MFWEQMKKQKKVDKSKKRWHNLSEVHLNQQKFPLGIPAHIERMMDMNEKEKVIKLSDAEEVCEFVRAAGMCDFDIDISDQRVVIDAKSILGVMGLGVERELTVKYGGEDMDFENVVSKYEVA